MIRLSLNLNRGMNGEIGYKYFGKSSRMVGCTPRPGLTCRPADPWIAAVKTPNLLMIYMKMQTTLLGFPNSSPTIVKMRRAISYGCDCRRSPLCSDVDRLRRHTPLWLRHILTARMACLYYGFGFGEAHALSGLIRIRKMICAKPMAAGSAGRVSHHWMAQISSMVRVRGSRPTDRFVGEARD